MSAGPTFSITNKTRGMVPRFPFEEIKNNLLGKTYDVSVALLTPKDMRQAMIYKQEKTKKDALASNVLAFQLSKRSGEILLCPATARLQAKEFTMDTETFLKYLFIHGLLHLKGHAHGATMESIERKVLRRFDTRANEQSRNRN